MCSSNNDTMLQNQCLCWTSVLHPHQECDDTFVKSLFRLSDEGGKLEFSLVSEGSLPRSSFDPKDVFIADTGKSLFVWVGKGASTDEKKNAMTYAHVSFS